VSTIKDLQESSFAQRSPHCNVSNVPTSFPEDDAGRWSTAGPSNPDTFWVTDKLLGRWTHAGGGQWAGTPFLASCAGHTVGVWDGHPLAQPLPHLGRYKGGHVFFIVCEQTGLFCEEKKHVTLVVAPCPPGWSPPHKPPNNHSTAQDQTRRPKESHKNHSTEHVLPGIFNVWRPPSWTPLPSSSTFFTCFVPLDVMQTQPPSCLVDKFTLRVPDDGGGDHDFWGHARNTLKEWGVVVLENVLPENTCLQLHQDKRDYFKELNPALKDPKVELDASAWELNTSPDTRRGLKQNMGVGNMRPVWDARCQTHYVFKHLYEEVADIENDPLIPSGDAINLRVPGGPFSAASKDTSMPPREDWAHLDQTGSDDSLRCIQGQLILTPSTGVFVATPKGHLAYGGLIERFHKGNDTRNWLLWSSASDIKTAKSICASAGATAWQIPIARWSSVNRMVPWRPGTMIVWDSRLPHSAMPPMKNDPEWRSVVYISMRPLSWYDSESRYSRKFCLEHNRVTNHWGGSVFPITQGLGRRSLGNVCSTETFPYVSDPSKIWTDFPGVVPDWNRIYREFPGLMKLQTTFQ
jgi:hypothetical protein